MVALMASVRLLTRVSAYRDMYGLSRASASQPARWVVAMECAMNRTTAVAGRVTRWIPLAASTACRTVIPAVETVAVWHPTSANACRDIVPMPMAVVRPSVRIATTENALRRANALVGRVTTMWKDAAIPFASREYCNWLQLVSQMTFTALSTEPVKLEDAA